MEAVYSMGHTLGVTPTDPNPASDGWRGKVQGGMAFTTEGGTRVYVGATYDGLFRDDFGNYGVTLDVTIPLRKAKAR